MDYVNSAEHRKNIHEIKLEILEILRIASRALLWVEDKDKLFKLLTEIKDEYKKL